MKLNRNWYEHLGNNDSSDGAVYTIKEKDKKKVDKTVIDLNAGKYYIFIVENDIAYKTNKYIEVK